MPIERRRRGSGITAKEETRITGPFGAAEHVERRRMIDRDFSFEGLIGGPLEAQMSRILEAAGITADLEPFIEELRKSLEAAGVEKSQVDAAAASYVKLADECKAPNWATIVQL